MMALRYFAAAALATGLFTASFIPLSASAAPAQMAQANAPPAPIPDAPMDNVDQSDAGALVVKIDRLENALRRASGQIEQLQNQQQRLQEQLKKFQEDVEFRLGGAKTPAASVAAPAIIPQAPSSAEASPNIKTVKRSDAFDPASNPNAAGTPKPLGAATPSAPLDLNRAAATPTQNSGAGVDFVDGPRKQYAQAMETFRQGQYEAAEQQAKDFLTANPSDRLTPDVIFLLGETYFQRQRSREAAEQYLRLSKDYAKSTRAPEALMRLGESLVALGNNEQACATFGEVGKRYPNASISVRKSVEREMQKNHC